MVYGRLGLGAVRVRGTCEGGWGVVQGDVRRRGGGRYRVMVARWFEYGIFCHYAHKLSA